MVTPGLKLSLKLKTEFLHALPNNRFGPFVVAAFPDLLTTLLQHLLQEKKAVAFYFQFLK